MDESALLVALEDGHLAWCGLDVTAREPPPMDDPPRQHPRVVLTPKTSVFSHRYMDHAVEFVADNPDRYLTGRPLRGFQRCPSKVFYRLEGGQLRQVVNGVGGPGRASN